MSLRIAIISSADLPELAITAELERENYPVVPIDRQRALAMACNPVASSSDPGMVVAYKDGCCVGYLGLLPQMLRRGQDAIKALAFSALYLAPSLRGSGLAARMIDSAREQGFPLLTIGNSLAAQAFFSKIGMRQLPGRQIVQLCIGPGAAVSDQFERAQRLLRRMGLPAMQAPVAGLKRFSLRAVGPFRRSAMASARRRLDTESSGLRAVAVDAFRPGVMTPIDALNLRVHWDSDTLNWMLAHPWIRTSAPLGSNALARYHFSTIDPVFRHAACELIDADDRLAGFAACTIHTYHGQRTVSLLQSAYDSPAGCGLILGHAIGLACDSNADIVRCGQQWLQPLQQAGLGNRLRLMERRSFVDAPMHADAFANYVEDFPDGDIAFY